MGQVENLSHTHTNYGSAKNVGNDKVENLPHTNYGSA